MEKITIVSAMVTIVILIILAIVGLSLSGNLVTGKNNQSILSSNETVSATPPAQQVNDSLIIPSNDCVINLINWSKYPLVSYHFVSKAVIEEPNSILNHSFIDVHITVGIQNPDDVPEVYKELSSIVKAEKALIGEDSSIEIFGYIEDGRIFLVGMLPYSTEIYRRDYVHPIHDLTFSDIDASEVD